MAHDRLDTTDTTTQVDALGPFAQRVDLPSGGAPDDRESNTLSV